MFNYYPPTYVLPGTTALAPRVRDPEFEHGDQPLQLRQHARVRHDRAAGDASGRDRHDTRLDGAAALAGDPNALLDKLDALLLHGTMPRRDAGGDPVAAVNAVSATDTLTRAKTAFYLVVTSPQYQVER